MLAGKAQQAIEKLAQLNVRDNVLVGRRHRALLRSLLDIHRERGRRALLREVAALLNRMLHLESVVVLRHMGGHRAFRVVASAGGGAIRDRAVHDAKLERLLTKGLRQRRPLMVTDFIDPTPRRVAPNGRRPSQSRAMIVRIDGLGAPFGLLTLRSRQHETFGAEEARIVGTVASLLSLAVKRFDNARRLRESARRDRSLLDGTTDVMFRASLVPALRIEHVSPAIAAITGYTPREFYQDPRLVTRLIHAEDLPAFRAELEHPEQVRDRVRLRIIGRDGQRRWVSVSRAPILDRRGRVVAVQGSLYDISDRVVADEQLRAAAESTASIMQGRMLETALRIILHHLRYALDADEAMIAANGPEKGALRIICRDGTNRGRSARPATVSQHDLLVRRVLAADQPVLVDRSIATRIHWSSGRLGVLIVRGVGGDNRQLAEAMVPVNRFAHEVAAAVESMRLHQEHLRQVIQEDRSRIARELHDGVVQSLFAAEMTLQLSADSQPEQAQGSVSQAAAGIRETIQDIQQYVFDLEPSVLIQGGLAASLQRMAVDFESSSGIAIRLEADPEVTDALEGVAAHVLQIVREALSNVRRHSQARSVAVTLQSSGRAKVLEIRDDGGGFTPEAQQGLGIRNLRTRARLLGGKLEVRSEPGQGSTVRLIVPSPVREADVRPAPLSAEAPHLP